MESERPSGDRTDLAVEALATTAVQTRGDVGDDPVMFQFSIARDSGGVSLVEGEHAAEPFASADAADGRGRIAGGEGDDVAQALVVALGERHLHAVLRDFVEHYHAERNHQGLGNVIPFPSRDSASSVGRIGRRQRLGGILSFYERNAA